MQGPALIITCGHKATEASAAAEFLPALERHYRLRGAYVLEFGVHHCLSRGREVGNGMQSAPKDFCGSSFKGTAKCSLERQEQLVTDN